MVSCYHVIIQEHIIILLYRHVMIRERRADARAHMSGWSVLSRTALQKDRALQTSEVALPRACRMSIAGSSRGDASNVTCIQQSKGG
jgi:hypothetical protein